MQQQRNVYQHGQNVHGSAVQAGGRAAINRILELSHGHATMAKETCVDEIERVLYGGSLWSRLLSFVGLGHLRHTHVRSWCEDDATVYSGMTYFEALERVWAVIEHHEHRDTLRVRLKEELLESVGMCFTGRVTRLFNALQGLVDGVHIGVSGREAMQARIAAIMARKTKDATTRKDLEEVLDDATDLMAGERDAWLQAYDDSV